MSIIILPSGELTISNLTRVYGSLQHSWKTLTTEIKLYAKTTGKIGNENKYEFPYPMNKMTFFGKCILVCSSGNLTIEMWNEFYETTKQHDSEDEEEHTYNYDTTSDNELEEEPYKIDLNKVQ
jgi:hypothetical protein